MAMVMALGLALPALPGMPALPATTGATPHGRRFDAVAAGLTHPSLVTVYAFERHESMALISMELLEGETLAAAHESPVQAGPRAHAVTTRAARSAVPRVASAEN